KDMLDIRKRFEPRAEELARKYALADYTMFIGSGALWGETILYSMCLLEEMQWKRIRHITSHDFFHGTLELLEPGVPVFLFMGEDECRALDERVRAFLTSGVTGDEDYVIIDTAEYAIPGLDDDFRVIVSPWILSVLTTDRLSRNYELVTKHNLKYRRYYHQFDYWATAGPISWLVDISTLHKGVRIRAGALFALPSAQGVLGGNLIPEFRLRVGCGFRMRPILKPRNGTRFPLGVRSGKLIPFRASNPGHAFRAPPLAESASPSKHKSCGTASAKTRSGR
ncbi:MAG: hypothetical protein ACLS3M_04040, partial [Collinsella sp.]